jgi:hypothetical protein|nr:MAG TPA: hypothetical protein [Caudoviricetes sp.]
MGSYGVIKEALLVKSNELTGGYAVVQKLVPSTVNGMVTLNQKNGGFEVGGRDVSIRSVYHGGAFGFSEWHESGNLFITVNIPGSGVKPFVGKPLIQNVNGVGQGVLCTPEDSDPTDTYTKLFLVVESPGTVFAKSFS